MKKQLLIPILVVLVLVASGLYIFKLNNNSNEIHPSVSIPPPTSSNANTEQDNTAKVEKLLNEIPLTKISTTKQEYEALGWNRYENKEIGFEMYYPSYWKVSESKERGFSDDPPYLDITFASKTFSYDFAFALYVYKEPLKENLVNVADREWFPIEKLQVNYTDAVIVARYSEENKRTYKNVTFGIENWTIAFVSWSNDPVIYEQMFKSFRLISER